MVHGRQARQLNISQKQIEQKNMGDALMFDSLFARFSGDWAAAI